MRHPLARLLACQIALGAHTGLGVQPVPSGTMATGDSASATPTTRTAEEQALVDTLVRLAQGEAQVDTELPRRLPAALTSGNPWVRANVFAIAPMVLGGLRASASARGPARVARFGDLYWSLAQAGLGDVDASVRRHALTAVSSFDLDAGRAATWQQWLRRLFAEDPAGVVRAAAFDALVSPRLMPGLDMSLVERAIADPSPSVKVSGFNVLWMRQAPGYQAVMLAKLHEQRDGNTRVAAAEALRNVVPIDGSVVDAVAARLAVERDPAVRQRLSVVLEQMQDVARRIKKPGA